jgi:ketosteroid isomerase-like protein
MAPMSKAHIIRSLFDGYVTKNRQVVEDLLADDFTFTSPYDDAIDRPTYFERCWPNSEQFRSVTVEKVSETGEHAFALYRAVMKDGREFRNTELFTFAGDRVRSVDVFFGASYRDGKFVKQQA